MTLPRHRLDLPQHLAPHATLVWRAVVAMLEGRSPVVLIDSLTRSAIELHPAVSRAAALDWLGALPSEPGRTVVLTWPCRLCSPEGPPAIAVHLEASHGNACGFLFECGPDVASPFASPIRTSPPRILPEVLLS